MLKKTLKVYIYLTLTLAIILLFFFMFTIGLESYRQSMKYASQNAKNISFLIAAQIEDTFSSVDIILQEFDNRLQNPDPSDVGSHSKLSDLMRKRLKNVNTIRAFFIIGPDGYIIHDTDHTTPHVSLRDREYFRYHEKGPTKDLYIASPVVSRSVGTWFVSVSRRISSSDGSFLGIIVAAMEITSLEMFYSKIEIGDHDLVSLWNEKGILLTSWPRFDNLVGSKSTGFKIFKAIKTKTNGLFLSLDSPLDSRRKLTAYDKAENYPLVAIVEIDRAAVISAWLKRLLPASFLFTVLVVTISVLAWILWKYFYNLQSYQDELKENNARLLKAEARYLKAQEMGNVGNWEYDIATGTFWGSDEAKRIYGFDPKVQKFTVEEVRKCIVEREKSQQALIDLLEKNIPYDMELEIQPVSGANEKIIRSVAEVIRNESGEPSTIIGVIKDVTTQKKYEESLKDYKDQLSKLNAHLQSFIEQERISIAREMHDDLGQTLAALKMDLGWINKRVPVEQEQILEKIKQMKVLIDQSVKSVKRICSDLRPGILDDLGLLPAIKWYIDQFEERFGIHCQLDIAFPEIQLDRELSTALYRILQEALTNVTRHAKANQISISIVEEGKGISLAVRDNGIGFDAKIIKSQSFGIIGMRERAYSLGGDFSIAGQSFGGTCIRVEMPINRRQVDTT